MAIEDIKRELEQRFDAPLDEFYKRRIIFWNDEDGDFKEQIADFSLSNALVLVLNETNQFESKRVLNTDSTSNYLVYNPLICDAETDWFLDIKLYSEEYRADLVSRWMQEMQIVNTPELRKLVKEHRNFLKRRRIGMSLLLMMVRSIRVQCFICLCWRRFVAVLANQKRSFELYYLPDQILKIIWSWIYWRMRHRIYFGL